MKRRTDGGHDGGKALRLLRVGGGMDGRDIRRHPPVTHLLATPFQAEKWEEEAAPIKADRDVVGYPVGTRVKLVGLVGAKQHNGKVSRLYQQATTPTHNIAILLCRSHHSCRPAPPHRERPAHHLSHATPHRSAPSRRPSTPSPAG